MTRFRPASLVINVLSFSLAIQLCTGLQYFPHPAPDAPDGFLTIADGFHKVCVTVLLIPATCVTTPHYYYYKILDEESQAACIFWG